jgi:hypothetical protein
LACLCTEKDANAKILNVKITIVSATSLEWTAHYTVNVLNVLIHFCIQINMEEKKVVRWEQIKI